MLQFGKITYGKKNGDKTTTIQANFGDDFILAMDDITGRKVGFIFDKLYSTEMTFYSFFTLEVYECLYKMLVLPDFDYIINRKAIRNVVNQMKTLEELMYVPHTEMSPEYIVMKEKEAKTILNYHNIKDRMRFGILTHQKRLFDDYALMKAIGHHRGRMASADPGTGKTFMALALAEALDAPLVVVIAPGPTVESVWVDSLTGEMYKHPNKYWDSLSKKHYYGERFMICHYEYIGKIIKELPKGKDVFLIVDESHNINEKGTKRASEIHQFINHVNITDVVLLSGTAIKGKPIETSNIIKFSDPSFTPDIEKRFGGIYTNPSYLFMSILSKRFDSVKTFISKTEMKLPPSSTQELVMKLKNGKYFTIEAIKKRMRDYSEKQNKLYSDNMEKYMARYDAMKTRVTSMLIERKLITQAELDRYDENFNKVIDFYTKGILRDNPKLVKEVNDFEKENILAYLKGDELKEMRFILPIIKFVSWKIQGEVLARVVMQTRIDLAISFARELDYKMVLGLTEKKVLFFSSYTKACEEVYESGSKFTQVGRVYGEHLEKYDYTLSQFKSNDKMGAIAATYKSLGTGTPVLSANLTVFLDMPFKSYIYTQAINRTHRQGQDKSCIFLQLLLDTGEEDNINSRNVDIIQMSKDIVESITRDPIHVEFKHLNVIEAYLENIRIPL